MMDLKMATMLVVRDALNDNNGNIGYEDVSQMSANRKTALTAKLMESDEFLQRFSDAVETVLQEYFDDFGDEYGIEE
jgi:hypothetical protein